MFKFFAASLWVLLICIASSANSCTKKLVGYSDMKSVSSEFQTFAARTSRVGDLEYLKKIVGAPPEHGSKGHCAEISYLADLHLPQNTLEQATCEVNFACWRFGDLKYGDLTELGFSKTVLLLEAARWHLDQKLFALKLHYDRARPYHVSLDLVANLPDPGHPSYPSGHAAQAHLVALIMADIMPDHRMVFLQDASRIAKNRERVKLHFPSDTEAGIRLAREMTVALKREKWFRISLKRATQEWVSLGGSKGLLK